MMDKKSPIDILIISEGTFPYVKGGVSTWIYDLITNLQELSFGVVFIGSKKSDYSSIQYEFPKNITYMSSHYLFDKAYMPKPKRLRGNRKAFDELRRLHTWFKRHKGSFPDDVKSPSFYKTYLKQEDFLYSKRAWEFIEDYYFEYAPELPFLYYFWTVRNIHLPIWRIADIVSRIPECKVIHSPSTGYAGLLGSFIRHDRDIPFILTEHGIYTKERKIDIMEAEWIEDARWWFQKEYAEVDHIKNMWINFFIGIGRFCYESADPIISLFEGARQMQISYGAEASKTIVIPNGIKIEKYAPLRKKRKGIPKVVALIGRVVPIKDIKTFIKAIRIGIRDIPDIQGWIIGPTDEDPAYYEECKRLTKVLDLERHVVFMGFKRLEEILYKVGIITLTSISEGMPLVILEGFAAGVPAVVTDVGSCKQLIYGGLDEDDLSIGKAGEVVPIADPSALAKAYVSLLKDKEGWEKARDAAIKRVERYYNFEKFLNSYLDIYRKAMNGRHRV
ncbi:MAG: glycosyl transferase family 1 [Deltaproteobacteria bacterium]|nr:MAG: glycosyl transferase family 1 [Deltaproteobacteria bacterium]